MSRYNKKAVLFSFRKKTSHGHQLRGGFSTHFSVIAANILVLIQLTIPASSQVTIWYEDFDNLPDGVTMHAGEAGWNRELQSASVSGHFEVNDNKYEAHYVNGEVLWVSEYINIKYFQNVGIRVDLAEEGIMESTDSVNVYYRVDGGPAIPLRDAKHNNDFAPVTATASGISGEKLQIIAHFRNGAEGEIHSLDNVYVTGEPGVMPADVVWYETFNDLDDNTTVDNGSSAWTRDISAASLSSVGYFDIRQYRLLGRDLGGEAVWTSEIIDISGQQHVDISADIYSYGLMESSEDYIRIYYRLNGGAETLLDAGEIKGAASDLITAYKNGLSGNSVQFVVRMLNTSENERQVLDNILVKSNGTRPVIWYEDFDNLPDGVTMHAGEAGWDRDLQSAGVSGHFEVNDQKYEAHYVNSEVMWVSEYINIRFFQNVGIAVDLASAGVLESTDSVNVYYRVDDGLPIPLWDAKHNGNFSPVTATASGISGEKLQIIAHFRNGAEGEIYTMDNVYVTGEPVVMPDSLIWYETFNDLADNTNVDSGSSAWNRDISNAPLGSTGYFTTRLYRFLGRYLNGEAVWTSEVINIAGHSVDISADIYSYGAMESGDYIRVYYKLNGGTETLLNNGEINGAAGDLVTAYKNDLSGNSIQLVVRMLNTAENERHVLDNILVKSNGASFQVTATGGEITCANNMVTLNTSASVSDVTYSWSGPGGFSSDLQNPVANDTGTYTVTVSYEGVVQTAIAMVTENKTIPDISVEKSGSIAVSTPGVTLIASSTAPDVTYSWEGFNEGENPVTVTDTGTFHVTVTDNTNGCINSSSIKVNRAPYVIWYEDFDNLPDGVTMHAGQAGWDRDLQSAGVSGHFEVNDNKYEAHFVNSEVLWVSEYINIRYFQNVGIQVDLASAGVLESSDSVNVYYRVDDGQPVPFQDAKHTGNFPPVTATVTGISGEKLQIIAHFRNGAEGEIHTMDNVYVTGESIVMSDSLVWYETFNDLPDYTTIDNGSSAWTRDISSATMSSVGYFDVRQYRLLARDLNGEAVWTSEMIDISGQQSVDILADIYGYGYMESGEDYIRVFYKLDGGPETLLINGEINGTAVDLVTAYEKGLSGNTVQFVTRTYNDTENERYLLDNVQVTFNSAVDFTINATGDGELTCNNPALKLNVISSLSGLTYSWTGPAGFSSPLQSPVVSAPGTYIVTATFGLKSESDTVTVTENEELPDLTASVSGEINCAAASVVLSASSPIPGVAFRWSGPMEFFSSQPKTTTTVPGNYTAIVINPLNGCTSVDTVTVWQNADVPEDIVATTEEISACDQTEVTLKGMCSTSGVIYNWSGPGGFTSAEQNSVVTDPGIYILAVTDSSNGCSVSASVFVEHHIANSLNPVATASGILTCVDTIVTLTGSANSGSVTYSWLDPNGFTSNEMAPVVSIPGKYILTVNDMVTGCTDSASVVVEQNIMPPSGLTASASDTLDCGVISVTLSASSATGGITYLWKDQQDNVISNEQFAVTSIPGNYSVTAADPVNGCKTIEHVTVTGQECIEE